MSLDETKLDNVFKLYSENITNAITAIERLNYLTCTENKVLQNLKTNNILELSRQILQDYLNYFYHTVHNNMDKNINTFCTEIRKYITIHSNCLVQQYADIFTKVYYNMSRDQFDTTDLEDYIESIEVQLHIMFRQYKPDMLKTFYECTDKCKLPYDSKTDPFNFKISKIDDEKDEKQTV
ncbi:MAG: hypothetical protein Faunusvirus17_13 [Faunusvirus sp.]|jgi:hypothetical protein|uniref:Uncharacterized protein n=1 Tax=Faunusvirus sp. TaxID=2487766 RepID=A0A3G4ZYU5_9VIRU|nr:MAG: hypothetical protein Faunusvirus17_13 [Faunusvirus sp.]